METKEVIYNGESVKIFGTDNPEEILVRFTDNITAYNKIKKAVIADKGRLNAAISAMIFGILEHRGLRTHFIRQISDTELLCRRLDVIPVEVIVRNVIAGSMASRLGLEEGLVPETPVIDLCYKNEDLGTPLINDHYAVALGLVSYDELKVMYDYAGRTNDFLTSLMKGAGIELVDFKLEFGRDGEDRIILADELTPDNARFRDMASRERLDRDRFRYDMGRVGEAYKIIYERLCTVLERNDADEQR